MTEKEFIINHIIQGFNRQYNQHIQIQDCDVQSIPPTYSTTIGYEVITKRFDDYLRLRGYFNVGDRATIGEFRLETDDSSQINRLGDEIFVAIGVLDRYYRENKIYRYGTLRYDESTWDILMTEQDEPLVLESGDYILTEAGV